MPDRSPSSPSVNTKDASPSGETKPTASPWYTAGMQAYGLGIRLVSRWYPQARAWRQGRAGGMAAVAESLASVPKPRIWMHCASLGEFEQGRPVLEAMQKHYPNHGTVVSFFSPSGYTVRRDWPGADAVVYLPLDTPANAKAFADCLEASIALWVRYEFWLNHLHAAAASGTRLYLIGARFDPTQRFFGSPLLPWTRWFQDGLRQFHRVFCQDEASVSLLEGLGLTRISQAADTRFDRVAAVADWPVKDTLPPALQAYCSAGPLLIAGSTWPADEKMLLPFLHDHLWPAAWRILLAPHQIDEAKITALCRQLPEDACRWSLLNGASVPPDCRVLVMDQIGLLGALYGLGQAAYVGGAFGTGLHNVLEPAAFGLPLAFGPDYRGFPEAQALIDTGAASSIPDKEALGAWFRTIHNAQAAKGLSAEGRRMGDAAAAYVAAHRGGTATIAAQILADEKALG